MRKIEDWIKMKTDKSLCVRLAAKTVLEIEKKRADFLEVFYMKKKISFPDNSEENAALFQKILDKANQQ